MTEEDITVPNGYNVDGRYQVQRKLGQGAFGAVYEVTDLAKKVIGPKALKLESIASRDQVLKVEVMVLKACQHSRHFCRLHGYGRNNRFNFMVMSLVGPSIASLRKKAPGQKFSRNSSIIVTAQCLEAIKDMHSTGWLHRDVKPSNFAMGFCPQARRTVHILDFGLSRTYITSKKAIRPPRELVGFRGTLRYCSLNAHRGKDLGRSDDLISLLIMMVEMLKGTLPWKHIDGNFETGQCKDQSAPTLYDPLPKCFYQTHQYLHTLRYEDTPRYNLFEEALATVVSPDRQKTLAFDWEGVAPQMALRNSQRGLDSAADNITEFSTVNQARQNKAKNLQKEIEPEGDMMSNVEELPKSRYKELNSKK